MSALIQDLKLLFLVLTTIITIYYFIIDYRKGFKYYMFFVILSGLFGFARPIFSEDIFLPIFIPLGILVYHKYYNSKKISIISLIILVYGVFITILSTDATFQGLDIYFIFGFVLLAFSNYFFGEDKQTVQAFSLLWLFSLARSLWLIFKGGSGAFQLAEDSRLLQIETGLVGANGVVNIDPNYLAFITGFGFILSLVFIAYREKLYEYFAYKFIQKRWFLVTVVLTGAIELWFSARGLSRGMTLAILASFLTFIFIEKKIKTFAISSIVLITSFFVFQGFIHLLLERFGSDNTGGGRFDAWSFIWDFMLNTGKVLWGFGLNYHWWTKWSVNYGLYFSTHNSWLTILLAVGIFGISLLMIYITKSVFKNLKSFNVVSKIRLIMLAYVIVSYSSIEPLINTIGWILLAVSTSYNTNNFKYQLRDDKTK